jgi:hypothetical protein
MILEVVLTVCLLATPKACHDERFKLIDPDFSLLQCQMGMVAILPEIAHYTERHPGWRINGWSCREYRPEKDV